MFSADPGPRIRIFFHPGSQLPEPWVKKARIRIRITCHLPGLQIRIHIYAEVNADWNS
jgi:hypothetical protein